MDILAVQQRLIDNGYQFIEHIFNDELSKGNNSPQDTYANLTKPLPIEGRNCYVTITSSTCNAFSLDLTQNKDNNISTHGWGRFPRMECWRMIAEWLDKKESGE